MDRFHISDFVTGEKVAAKCKEVGLFHGISMRNFLVFILSFILSFILMSGSNRPDDDTHPSHHPLQTAFSREKARLEGADHHLFTEPKVFLLLGNTFPVSSATHDDDLTT